MWPLSGLCFSANPWAAVVLRAFWRSFELAKRAEGNFRMLRDLPRTPMGDAEGPVKSGARRRESSGAGRGAPHHYLDEYRHQFRGCKHCRIFSSSIRARICQIRTARATGRMRASGWLRVYWWYPNEQTLTVLSTPGSALPATSQSAATLILTRPCQRVLQAVSATPTALILATQR